MSRLIGAIVNNPAVLLWIAAGAFLFGLLSGGGVAWKVQGWRLASVQAQYDGFKSTVAAEGEAAKRAADKQILEDKRKKENADHEYEITIAGLNDRVKRLRDARSGSGTVPAAPAGSVRTDLACFDRAELERTLRNLDEGIQRIVDEGSAETVALNVARRWAASRTPDKQGVDETK